MVVNGATKFDDMKHFDKYLAAFKAKGGDVSMEYLHEQNLIALQGALSGRVANSSHCCDRDNGVVGCYHVG